MSAFHAAWRALSDLQAARGRTIWIQVGWLYLDTIAIVKEFAARPQDYVYLPDVQDLGALSRLLAERGDRVAGIVTEAPTNPLIQTADLAALPPSPASTARGSSSIRPSCPRSMSRSCRTPTSW